MTFVITDWSDDQRFIGPCLDVFQTGTGSRIGQSLGELQPLIAGFSSWSLMIGQSTRLWRRREGVEPSGDLTTPRLVLKTSGATGRLPSPRMRRSSRRPDAILDCAG